MTERSKQNKCDDDDNGDGVDNSDDSGDKPLTHVSLAVDRHLTERSKETSCVLFVTMTMVLTIVLMIVMKVPTSTSHISHKQLIVI